MQSRFSALEFAARKKLTRRGRFLREIDAVTPWSELIAKIEPLYPSGAGRGRPPIGLPRMLRMYVVRRCLWLSGERIEDAVYDSQAIFEAINAHLAARGLLLREGSVVDAKIISAPNSTKNDSGTRDPEMHPTKKGKNWFFGMKAHIGADRDSGLVHTVVGTADNVSDVTVGNALLHGQETDVFADAGYQGVDKRDDATGACWHVAMKPSVRRRWKRQPRLGKLLDFVERAKAAVRATGEHSFHIVKNRFGLKKVRYRGLAKNTAQLFTLFGLANLLIAKQQLFALQARGAS